MKLSTFKTDITPTSEYFPCYLSGHAIRTEIADGILDQIYAVSTVLDVDGVKTVWLTVELIGLDRSFTEDIRKKVAIKYNLDYNNIYVNYIHSHSCPEYSYENAFGGESAKKGYPEYVKEQALKAIDTSMNANFKEVEAYYRTVTVKGCYSNRNGLDKPCDKDVTVIIFKHEDKIIGGICNFTCHSTVLGPQNLKVSSDLAGYVARYCKDKWGIYPNVIIGAAGDMSNRLYRKGNDEKELLRVGNEMMSQVFKEDTYTKLNISKPVVIPFSYKQTFIPNKEEKLKQYNETLDRINNAKNYDEKKVYTSALAVCKKGLEIDSYTLDLECYYVNMGDLRYFVIPAELFSRFGVEIKKAMNCKCPILWGYTNYSVGYLGNIDDYGASFETVTSNIPCGTTEKIVKLIVDLIKKENGDK